MKYQSTRGQAPILDFRGATLAGLADDGGLYVPETWPRLSPDTIGGFAGASYVDIAVAVMAPYVAPAIDAAALRDLCTRAYARFEADAVTPIVALDDRHRLLELFHGPTLAFKDVALQLLGLLFERFGEPLTIIGATSGDTGSAAIDAVAGRAGLEIFMLHPHGRVSDVQRRQMTTVADANVHNIAIDGSFDDAQAIVKALFADPELRAARRLSAVNSINWARLMAQIVYYFYAAARIGGRVAFSVPTGNFGDVFAGYVAGRMGLAIDGLIVATNVNDILARALATGDYSRGVVTPTDTPSMDIQVSSNFERLLWDVAPDRVAAMMATFEATGRLAIPDDVVAAARAVLTPVRVDAGAMADAMRWARDRGQVIDPHTAVALAAARATPFDPDVTVVTLATAHPAKFGDAVTRAIGTPPPVPPRIAAMMEAPERCLRVPATVEAVRAHILARP